MEHNKFDDWYRQENRDEYANARNHMNAFAKKGRTLYSNVIYTSFPRGDLPIVSQDFTYTMDIMYMTILDTEDDRTNYQNKRYRIDVQPSTIFVHLIDSMRETIT